VINSRPDPKAGLEIGIGATMIEPRLSFFDFVWGSFFVAASLEALDFCSVVMMSAAGGAAELWPRAIETPQINTAAAMKMIQVARRKTHPAELLAA